MAGPIVKGGRLRVLLVEDSADDALLLKRQLKRSGYSVDLRRVESTEGMREALAEGGWDAVISDYFLPRFGAVKALEIVRQQGEDVPFIVVSGRVGEEAAVELMRAGAHDYIPKGSLSRLVPVLERELREARGRHERRRVEAALKESEGLYRSVVGQAGEGILLVDLETKRILEANDFYCELLEYTARELTSMTIYDVVAHRRESVDYFIGRIVASGRYRVGERQHRRKDGALADVEVSASVVAHGGRRVLCIVARDITERKRHEREMARLASFPQLNPNPVVEMDREGQVTYANPAAVRAFPDLAELGDIHPALSGIEETIASLEGKDFAVREVEVSGRYYYQTIQPIPGRDLVRIYFAELTELRRAEKELRESQGRYRAVVAQTSEGIVFVDLQSKRVLEINPALENMLGYEPGELLGHGVWEFIAETPQSIDANVSSVQEFGHHFIGERRYRRKDGTLFDVEVSADKIRYGEMEVLCAVVRDITPRKRAEKALRESEDKFRRLVESAADAIFVHDLEGRFVDVNRQACESLGYSREQLVSMSVPDIELNFTPGALWGLWHRMEAGEPMTVDGVHRRSNGSTFPVEVRVGLFEAGERPLMVAIARDVSERRRAEEEIRQSEERYRAVVEQAVEGIFLFDVISKRIVEANPAFCALVGYSAGQLTSMTVYELVPGDPESVDRNVGRVSGQEQPFTWEHEYLRGDGTYAEVEVTGSIILYGGRRLMCAVVRDISERRRHEQALKEIREAERNRMARDLHDGALQDMMYVLQSLDLLRMNAAEETIGSELLRDVKTLRRAVGGLREAIYNLRAGGMEERPLVALMESLIELSCQLDPQKKVELVVEEGFPRGLSGAGAVETLRIVQEALNNVRRHSVARNARITLGSEEGGIFVEVSDDGKGFEVEAAWGGVGLSSMRERALLIGGELEVSSAHGAGTTVRLSLPYAQLEGWRILPAKSPEVADGPSGLQKNPPSG